MPLFIQLRLAQNVFPLMRFLILGIAKSHAERDLVNNEGVVNNTGVRFLARNCALS